MPTPLPNDALLCERCGYEMSSLGLARRCPECGADLAADVAARFAAVRRPRRGWFGRQPGERSVDEAFSVSLFRTGLVFSLSLLAPLLALFAEDVILAPRRRSSPYFLSLAPLDAALLWLAIALVLLSLSIPVIGCLAVFTRLAETVAARSARILGWRLSPTSVRAVQARAFWGIGFAASGWALAWAGTAVAVLTAPAVVGRFGEYINVFQAAVLVLGLGTYFVRFALGVWSCRFANSPEVVGRHMANPVATIRHADATTN